MPRKKRETKAKSGRLARQQGAETTLTIRQIAGRLRLGSWKSLNHKLYLASKQAAKEPKSKKNEKGKVMV